MKSKRRTALEVDLFTGKDEIDREEREFLEEKYRRKGRQSTNWFYRRFVAWLF